LVRKWTNILIWPRDRASISVQQLRIQLIDCCKLLTSVAVLGHWQTKRSCLELAGANKFNLEATTAT
jgi:hypothetical protein